MPGFPYAKKSLGQHWLADRSALEAICDAAVLTASDTVLEIGPGLGTLTSLLVQRVQSVIAVELDEDLASILPIKVPASNLTVIKQDILQFDFSTLPPGYILVANIPYYLTSNLIRLLSETVNPPVRAVILIQKEVAERVAARPGSMSMLAITAQYFWDVSLGRTVPARLFVPPPKVDSQVVILNRIPSRFIDVDTRRFFRIVKAGFSQRRKTLLNSLSAGMQLDKKTTASWLAASNVSPSERPQALTFDAWHALYENIPSN